MFHFKWLLPYESCRLWRNDHVRIFLLRNDFVICEWSNILILLLTISTTSSLLATCDHHSKHCNYDVMIKLSFFYYVIITLALRDKCMSHSLSRNMKRHKLYHMSHCDYDLMITYWFFIPLSLRHHYFIGKWLIK